MLAQKQRKQKGEKKKKRKVNELVIALICFALVFTQPDSNIQIRRNLREPKQKKEKKKNTTLRFVEALF